MNSLDRNSFGNSRIGAFLGYSSRLLFALLLFCGCCFVEFVPVKRKFELFLIVLRSVCLGLCSSLGMLLLNMMGRCIL